MQRRETGAEIMKFQATLKCVFLLLLLAACMPFPKTELAPTSVPIILPEEVQTNSSQPVIRSMDELRAILYASNPESSQYNPQSAAYAAFPQAVAQLSMMDSAAVDAAGDLAGAISFPVRNRTWQLRPFLRLALR